MSCPAPAQEVDLVLVHHVARVVRRRYWIELQADGSDPVAVERATGRKVALDSRELEVLATRKLLSCFDCWRVPDLRRALGQIRGALLEANATPEGRHSAKVDGVKLWNGRVCTNIGRARVA